MKLRLVLLLVLGGLVSARAQDSVVVALWGDSRENLDGSCERIASILLNERTNWDVQVHTGDFTHHGAPEDWERSLKYAGIDKIFVPGKFLMCTSNHDAGSEAQAGVDLRATYDKYTKGVLPTNDVDGTTHFFAWHKGNVHILVLDGILTEPTVMQTWLDRTLDGIRADDWIVAVWHQPAFTITYKEPYYGMCHRWLESLQKHHAAFIFNGHAHQYIRTKPLNADGNPDPAAGIVHIVNGTGGASWKDPAPASPMIAFTPDSKSFPCVTFITFKGTVATVKTIDARPDKHLSAIDEWTWNKQKGMQK
jgi:hypothetical protein